MLVYLLRHGDAVAARVDLRDAERHLSDLGRAQVVEVAQRLHARGAEVAAIWTSPLVRAVQTAELAARELGLGVEVVRDLAPGGDGMRVIDRLRKADGPVLAAGHEPLLSGMASLLCGGRPVGALARAEVLAIERDRVAWRLAPA